MKRGTDYLIDVLGVRELLMPTENEGSVPTAILAEASTESAATANKVLFVFADQQSRAGLEMFEKMIAAMKLASTQIETLVCAEKTLMDFEIETLSCLALVFLGDELNTKMAEWVHLADSKSLFYVRVQSPDFMIKNPNTKKQAWEQLQRVMAHVATKTHHELA